MPLRNRVTVRFVTRLPGLPDGNMVYEPASLDVKGGFVIIEEEIAVEVSHSPVSNKAMPYVTKMQGYKTTVFPSHVVQYVQEESVAFEEADV